MPSKTLALCNVKGGCGKSSIATNIAISMMKKKKKVYALDLDPQGAMEACLIDYEGKTPNLNHKNIPQSALGSVSKLVTGLVNEADNVILDVAGGDMASMLNILGFTDWIVLPTRPSKKDIAATTTMIVAMAKRGDFVANPHLNAVIIMNQCSYHPLSTTADEAVEALNSIITQCGLQKRVQVLKSRLTISTAWIEADMESRAICEMTKSKSAKQWEALMKEMTKLGVL